jgi:hypothetical protein
VLAVEVVTRDLSLKFRALIEQANEKEYETLVGGDRLDGGRHGGDWSSFDEKQIASFTARAKTPGHR